MATIYQLDMKIHIEYARRTQFLEQFKRQYRLEEAAKIPPETQLVNLYQKRSELDLLLGIAPVHTPWAYFFPPDSFSEQRQSPFAFHRVLPALGSFDKQQDLLLKIEQVRCSTPRQIEEKQTLVQCVESIDKINGWLHFIIGRIGQFLQG
ncbi:MAG: hypothetical protein K0S07_1300 [Chlamydiales bacterium]|jgi:hypothetical protein|nr:hypothetical protein [Chlamydiales bacterium]